MSDSILGAKPGNPGEKEEESHRNFSGMLATISKNSWRCNTADPEIQEFGTLVEKLTGSLFLFFSSLSFLLRSHICSASMDVKDDASN